MKSSLVHIRDFPTPEIIDLLESVTLGTNGAHYRHLDTRERISVADNPVFLSLERNGKVLGNITFCKRETNWYIRYFAFDNRFQASGNKKSSGDNLIKREIVSFFIDAFEKGDAKSFYAYIDPNNVKSLWMSENFGFKTISRIATQSFSRVSPKDSNRIQKINDWDEIRDNVRSNFSHYQYYFETQSSKPPFYILKDENDEIIANAKINLASWEIKRLPGKFGGVLTKLIPFIPRLNKIIRPKKHSFVVPDSVWVKDDNPKILEELFEGILFHEKQNLILWWLDEKDKLYCTVKSKTKWGLLHKIIGVSYANVVVRKNGQIQSTEINQPVFTSGFDFI